MRFSTTCDLTTRRHSTDCADGIPDSRLGEELCAWIIAQDGEAPTEADIIDYCRGRIAHYKIPRYVRFVLGFPMTVTGKIQKYLIRDAMKKELSIEEIRTA